jgi:hypothetical protein
MTTFQKIGTISAIIVLAQATIFAQSDVDALRYSTVQSGSTARSLGTGGTMGALGSDFSAASNNPAGLANYRQGEFAFSPGLYMPSTDATVGGTTTSDSKVNFNLGHIGLVLPSINDDHTNWKAVVFGLGYNRLANFNGRTFLRTKSVGSIADEMARLAQGKLPDQLDYSFEGLGYYTYLIDTFGSQTAYHSEVYNPNALIDKEQIINTSGGTDEITIALAGNYRNVLNIGATFGIPIINYTERKTYKESTTGDVNFQNTTYTEYLNTAGAGVNLKLGATLRATQWLRFGAALHTPTYYTLTDSFSRQLTTNTVRAGKQDSTTFGYYKYSMTTPLRAIGSISLVSPVSSGGVSGLLNGEIEWVDYGTMRYIFDQSSTAADKNFEQQLNNTIRNKYQTALNLRVGGELAIDVFRLRAGYGIFGTPFRADATTVNATARQATFGVGLRQKYFTLDLAYAKLLQNDEYTPYLTPLPSALNVARKLDNNKIVLTMGFRF